MDKTQQAIEAYKALQWGMHPDIKRGTLKDYIFDNYPAYRGLSSWEEIYDCTTN